MSREAGETPWANRIVGHGEEAPGSLVPHPRNWRQHGPAQQQALQAVLSKVGLVQSVVVNRTTGRLIDGHLRVELAKSQGQPTIPVVYVELSEDEESIILASLDPIAAMAGVERETLAQLLASIETEDEAVRGLLERIAREERVELALPSGLVDPDSVPDPSEQLVTETGDLWLLGDNKQLCGDSTKAEDVRRLMAGEKAALMATDPPYLVDYQGGAHPASDANAGAATKDKTWDTYVDHAHSVEFYVAFLKTALECALDPDAAIYQCYGMMRSEVIWQAWREAGLLAHQVVVWKKTRSVLTYSWYMWDYEPVLVGWPAGHQPKTTPPPEARAVWEVASTEGNEASVAAHPTVKPVELIRRPILYHTRPGDLIYEPFSGSGTAIIAAGQTGRRCRALELAPAFCDVAVRRWERFTGKQAVLEGDGRSFDEVAHERLVSPD